MMVLMNDPVANPNNFSFVLLWRGTSSIYFPCRVEFAINFRGRADQKYRLHESSYKQLSSHLRENYQQLRKYRTVKITNLTVFPFGSNSTMFS